MVQRHYCLSCQKTYSEGSALLVRGSWYGREVHRLALDFWQHGGCSYRRSAEFIRSFLGHQERWLLWNPLFDGALTDVPKSAEARGHCYLL
jgi:hypothetical protein